MCLRVFKYQALHTPIYKEWVNALHINLNSVSSIEQIPFLPVNMFRDHAVLSNGLTPAITFSSSGTTGMITSSHHVVEANLYEESFLKGFERIYGDVREYVILGLLPAYLERPGSSLVYMTQGLIEQSGQKESGFYLNELDALVEMLHALKRDNKKVWLIGVSFALLDLAEKHPPVWDGLTVVETGGMKGRRKEMIREELHATIKSGWPLTHIHSEYGMTELLSQAWMGDLGRFVCPPWMDIYIRDANDPMAYVPNGKTGGINVIDLANLDSCAFISTQDLGKRWEDGTFDVLGRFDNSDLRGCNLMVQ